eukprot:g1771.t1
MRFAGRRAIGARYPRVTHKQGMWHSHEGRGDPVMACGLACSEVFSGPQLARVLRKSHQIEGNALAALMRGDAAETLSLHTSAGVTPAMSEFLDTLTLCLPKDFQNKADDVCVSLQLTGTDAVWAAADLLLQLQSVRGNVHRNRVAVADWSYHGPGASAFGRAAPLGEHFKSPLQCNYPCPSIFARRTDELDIATFHARMLMEFNEFLDSDDGQSVGVLLIEPQWGSSNVAQPWDPELLRKYVDAAQARGILVCSDEIMCGLGRHGKGTMFLSEAWDIPVDAVTFGKSVAAGLEPLAGVAIRRGAQELSAAGKSTLQSHTYCGASTRALTTAGEVMSTLSHSDGENISWLSRVMDVGDRVLDQQVFPQLREASGGTLGVHGQGFMWGGAFLHADPVERSAAVDIFKSHCLKEHVMPYIVPQSGGFMFTPTYDAPEDDLIEAGRRLGAALEQTAKALREDRQWDQGLAAANLEAPLENMMLSLAQPPVGISVNSSRNARRSRYKGPINPGDPMTPRQREIYDKIARSRTTGAAGPFGPWLANPELAQHAQMLGKTCRYDLESYDLRLSELAILVTAIHTNAPTEWTIHVEEARKAGLEESIIRAVEIHGANMPTAVRDEVFDTELFDPVDRAVYDFVAELNREHGVSDESYWALHNMRGDLGLVELVGLVGYYGLVSMTLNTFEIEPPTAP